MYTVSAILRQDSCIHSGACAFGEGGGRHMHGPPVIDGLLCGTSDKCKPQLRFAVLNDTALGHLKLGPYYPRQLVATLPLTRIVGLPSRSLLGVGVHSRCCMP